MDVYRNLEYLETLLVEDDPLVRDAMTLGFRTQKLKVSSVESAEEGLKLLHEKRFDIIISDYGLPGINGITFLKQALFSQPEAVKLLISGNVNEELVSESYAVGIHDYLQKPFRLETLWATMAMHAAKMDLPISGDCRKADQLVGAVGM